MSNLVVKLAAFALATLLALTTEGLADPLPSWADTATRTRIISFVEAVTDPASDAYVTPSERVAVFDNDGTLWSEKPMYFQILFAIDQVAKMGAVDPSILTSDALRAAADNDIETLMAGGVDGLYEVLVTAHSGMTADAFRNSVLEWLESARHPDTGKRFDDMVYQPMLELLRYLRDEGFETYIVSGGGIDFMRVFTERVYGITPENVVGSSLRASYQVIDGVPSIVKEGESFFYNDKEDKPIGIYRHIGKRPIFAAGNSDGDFAMVEYTTAGDGARLGMFVHHTDDAREWAYDREGHVGVLDRGLDEAESRGYLLVDMAKDWSKIYPAANR